MFLKEKQAFRNPGLPQEPPKVDPKGCQNSNISLGKTTCFGARACSKSSNNKIFLRKTSFPSSGPLQELLKTTPDTKITILCTPKADPK